VDQVVAAGRALQARLAPAVVVVRARYFWACLARSTSQAAFWQSAGLEVLLGKRFSVLGARSVAVAAAGQFGLLHRL